MEQEPEIKEQSQETTDQGTVQNESAPSQPRHHAKPQPTRNTMFKVRQVLNLLFMLLGVIGAVMYSGLVGTGTIEQMGGIIVIIAISMKMAECVLRYIK